MEGEKGEVSMGSVGKEVSGGGLALMPSDTSQNVELTRQFMFDTGINVPMKIVMSTDGQTLADLYDTVRDMKKRYPTLMAGLTAIGDETDNNSFGSTDGSTLYVNTAYFGNTQGLDTLYASTVSSGFHPAGTTWKDIDTHELGHIAMHAIGKKWYTDPKEFQRRWNNGTLPARLVHEAYDEIKSAPNSYGFPGKLPSEADLRKAISTYASQNFHETVAEAWTDYHANGNASKAMSRAIYAVMQRYM